MAHFRCAPTRPWQTIIVAISRATDRLKRCAVKGMLVFHVQLEALRRLAGIANRLHPAVELTCHIFDQWLITIHGDVPEHPISKAQLFRELIDDSMVGK